MSREKTLDKKVMDFIRSQGGWCVKYWAGSPFTKSGIPDILACINGQFYAIEDKAENGKPTLLQLVTLKKMRCAGAVAILLYPDDFVNFQHYVQYDDLDAERWCNENILLQRKWKDKLENT